MRIPRVAVKTSISMVVILILLIIGGVAYTYFMGSGIEPGTIATPPSASPAGVLRKPAPAPPNAPVSASVQSLLSPVAPGANTSMSVRTRGGASCKITVVYGAVASKDSGLAAKTADEYGIVNWTWTVEATVPPGKYPVEVNCARGEKSAMVRGELAVEKPAAP